MGIRGLETFIKQFVHNGFIDISIVEEIKKYSSEKKQKPVLVIDLVPFIRLMFREKKDILYGGRYNKYSEILDKLFKKLIDAGAELIFFEDGLIETSKYVTWIARQNQRYDEHIQIFNYINTGYTVNEIVNMFGERGLSGFSTVMPVIEEMARKHGELIFSVNKDCDVEMVRYANDHKVLAILSDDSDFLIFKGDWKYWSINNLDVDTLRTREMNRKALRKTLGLTDEQLSILPTIAGNDIIRYDEVQEALGNYFRHTPKLKFPNIAKFIKNELPVDKSAMIQNIALKMLHNTRPETLKRVKESLNAYNSNFEDKEYSPLLQCCLDNSSIISFKTLNKFPKNFTLVYFDLRKTDFPSYHEIAVPLFQRQLGILFFEEKTINPDMTFEIYSRKSHHGSFEKFAVEPIYPESIEVPSLTELFDQENSELDNDRYELLKWTVSYKMLKDVDLSIIPNCYFLDILSLVLMKDLKVITTEEADIFMYTFMNVEKGKIDENIKYAAVLDEKAFRLAFLFGKIREAIYISLEFVGLKKHATVSSFDGVFFHNSYLEHKDEGKTFEDTLEKVKDYRYYK